MLNGAKFLIEESINLSIFVAYRASARFSNEIFCILFTIMGIIKIVSMLNKREREREVARRRTNDKFLLKWSESSTKAEELIRAVKAKASSDLMPGNSVMINFN